MHEAARGSCTLWPAAGSLQLSDLDREGAPGAQRPLTLLRGGRGKSAEDELSDLFSPQFPRRWMPRPLRSDETSLPCCDPLPAANLPASGAPASQRLPLPGRLHREVAKSVPFELALQPNVVPIALPPHPTPNPAPLSGPSFASRPFSRPPACSSASAAPVRFPAHTAGGALSVARVHWFEKEKGKKKVLSFCAQRKGAPCVSARFPP